MSLAAKSLMNVRTYSIWRIFKLSFGLLLPLFSCTQVIAQITTLQSSTAVNSKAVDTSLNTDLKMNWLGNAYSSQSEVDQGFVQQVEVEFNMKKRGRFFSNTEIMLGSFTAENGFYYMLAEAYMGYGTKSLNYTFGRKTENLSFADSFFNLGLMQSTFTHDFINYRQAGLTGLGVHYSGKSFGFNLGLNPIYMPNQGPQVQVQDGKVTSVNRWANKPPEEFKFGDQNREIVYAVNDYNLSDIVFNPGYVANFYIGENKKRPNVSFTYANKPVNDVALSRDMFADIATFRGNVFLNPVVLYHQIYAADISFDSGNIKSTLSYVGDYPVNQTAPDSQAIQNLSPISISSVYLGYDFAIKSRPLEVYVAAMAVSGGEIQDVESNGQPSSVNYASSRSVFRKPMKAGVKGDLIYIAGKPLTSDLAWTYDQELRGSLLSVRMKYDFTENLNMQVGADILGVESVDTDKTQSNYLYQNQENDRFSAGVGYVF